ncbi:hypothetical protein RUND412_011477, partial [Rhizina undulata]
MPVPSLSENGGDSEARVWARTRLAKKKTKLRNNVKMVEAVKVKSGNLILLTGASGFVAGHVLNSLLDSGYRVRCTVRSKAKFDEI